MNKHSQTTLFVIIAVFIVAAALLYFVVIKNKTLFKEGVSFTQPEEYIKKCASDSAKNATELMYDTGGYLNPTNYVLYDNNKVVYLCFTRTYYESCVMQEPLYVNHLQDEIKSYITPKIKDCFYNLRQEYEKRGYEVTMDSNPEIIVTLKPNKIDIDVKMNTDGGLVIKKGDETKRYEKFKTAFSSPLYDLANLALEISSQEAKYCHFSTLGFSLFYPDTEVSVNPSGTGTQRGKVYIITDKSTGKKLYFAIRSCEIPPGV
jgi:hypothetical protein